MQIFKQLSQLSRSTKKVISGSSDIIVSLFSLEVAFLMRLEEWVRMDDKWLPLFVLTPLLTLFIFYAMGLYRVVIRHVSLDVVIRIILAVGMVSVLIWVINNFLLKIPGLPRSVIAIFGLVLLSLVLSSRLLMHLLLVQESRTREKKIPVAIYGANTIGIQVAALLKSIDSHYQPLFFIDERPERQGQEVGSLRVWSLQNLEKRLRQKHVKDIFAALPAAPDQRVEILNKLSLYPAKVRVLPSKLHYQFNAENTETVCIEDLLEREKVPSDYALLERDIKGNNILVTGAAGSIGSQLCKQIMHLQPRKLFVVEQSEYTLFRLVKQLRELAEFKEIEIVSHLESVTNAQFIDDLFAQNQIDVIYHVAAYKHVPLVEENIISGIANNVFGTQVVAESAVRRKVGCLVLISTDKAVQPTSIMGASKRLAEMIIQSLAAHSDTTRFCTVRFGNVMGTSGSVIPLFQEQINKHETIYVTDPDAERYFMTVEEATELIIQAGAMSNKGEIFILDMGEAINILDIAKKMIHLSGLEVKENGVGDIEIVYTGLRPGEKLKEQLYSGSDIYSTDHPKIMGVHEPTKDWDRLSDNLSSLAAHVERRDTSEIEKSIKDIVPSYNPKNCGDRDD